MLAMDLKNVKHCVGQTKHLSGPSLALEDSVFYVCYAALISI